MAEKKPRKIRRLSSKKGDSNAIRILYVEDAAVIRDTIAKLLELKGGFKVAYARNGQEGVERALSWRPDIVLMDLRMPVMDGFEAITHIKEHPQTQHLPVFVISAWSGEKERSQAHVAGADEFFVKPPDIEKLTQAIHEAVAAAKQE